MLKSLCDHIKININKPTNTKQTGLPLGFIYDVFQASLPVLQTHFNFSFLWGLVGFLFLCLFCSWLQELEREKQLTEVWPSELKDILQCHKGGVCAYVCVFQSVRLNQDPHQRGLSQTNSSRNYERNRKLISCKVQATLP